MENPKEDFMETWKEVRDLISDSFEGSYNAEKDSMRALLTVNGDRTQFVEITRNGNWIEVSSCVGYIEKADIFDFLDDLSEEFCGGAVRRDLDIYVREGIRFEDIDEDGISTLFYRIAKKITNSMQLVH